MRENNQPILLEPNTRRLIDAFAGAHASPAAKGKQNTPASVRRSWTYDVIDCIFRRRDG